MKKLALVLAAAYIVGCVIAIGTTFVVGADPPVDHCEFVGLLTDEAPPPDSPFTPPATVPDDERTITVVQECRIRVVNGSAAGGSTVLETRTLILDLAGDDLATLRDAIGGTGAPPDEGITPG